MPRVKDTVHPLSRLLKGYEVNGKNLADCLGCAPETARKKLADPDRLTVGDLRRIHYSFGIPVDDIRELVCR